MATLKPFSQGALDSAQAQADATQKELQASNTAYSADTPPSSNDVAANVKLTGLLSSIRQMQGQKINQEWYGPQAASDTQPDLNVPENQGIVSKVLTDLSKPLYGVVGAAESALGQGAKPGFFENVGENMQEGHRTWGNLLQKIGAPKIISAPLGFALDITTDPVMMLSGGAESLIPRVGQGLIKGTVEGGIKTGLEAAGAGAASGLGRAALDTADLVSGAANFVTRGALPKLSDEAATNMMSRAYRSFTDSVVNQTAKYESLIGYDPLAKLGHGLLPIDKLTGGLTLGSYVQGIVLKIPGGNEFLDKFVYDPYRYNQLVKLNDRIIKIREMSAASTVTADVSGSLKGIAGSAEGDLRAGTDEGLNALNNPNILENQSEFKGDAVPGPDLTVEQAQIKNNIGNGIDDAIHIAQQGAYSEIQAKNALDLEARLEAEVQASGFTMEDIHKFMNMESQKTGINWFDKASEQVSDKIKNFKINNPWTKEDIAVGEGLLLAMDSASKIFKASKTTLSLGSHVRNAGTNVFFMHGIGFGLSDVTKAMSYVKDASNILGGSADSKLIEEMFIKENTDFSKFRSMNPGSFKSTYGLNPTMLGGKYFAGKVMREALLGGMTKEEVDVALRSMPDEIRAAIEKFQEANGAAKDEALAKVNKLMEKPGFMKPNAFRLDTPGETTAKAEAAGDFSGSNPSSAIGALDLTHGPFNAYMKEKIAAGSKVHKIIQDMLDTAASSYERKDQSFKLGQSMFLTHHGVSADTLNKMSRMIPDGITKADVILGDTVGGQQMYKLTWDKATDIANETYMNYAAMPAFVRMIRTMPILGAPFVSFTYAAIPKLAKTIYHNPGSFNDINYALNEFSGNKSPLEMQNIASKYGTWFNSPGMYRVPFFNDRPMYVNTATFQYQYQLSTMNPSNRSYKEALPNSIVQLVDKLQIMKDPVGQMIFDNILLPLMLPKGERPMSSFGSPLYPIDATAGQKIGYAARNLGEAYVPGNIAPIGVIGGLVAPGLTQKVPLYNYRKIAEGMQDNKPLGQPSTEGVASLTAKNLAAFAGLSYNNMDLSYLNSSKKKKGQ